MSENGGKTKWIEFGIKIHINTKQICLHAQQIKKEHFYHVLVDNSNDQDKLFREMNKIVHRKPKQSLPEHEEHESPKAHTQLKSKPKVLANAFNKFCFEQIEKKCLSLVTSQDTFEYTLQSGIFLVWILSGYYLSTRLRK